MDKDVLKEFLKAARDGATPSPLTKQQAQEYVGYLLSRGIRVLPHFRSDGICDRVDMTGKKPGAEDEKDNCAQEPQGRRT
jgi:hypothetical protein